MNRERKTYKNMKYAFLISFDFKDQLEAFTEEEKGIILDWIFRIATSRRENPDYVFNPEGISDRAIRILLQNFDRLNRSSEEKYLKALGTSSNGGVNSHQDSPLESSGVHSSVTDTHIDTVTDTEKHTVTDTDTSIVPSHPSLSDIKAFCEEQKLRIDPERFFNYYEAQNWMIGNSRITNWRAKIKEWAKNDFSKKSRAEDQHSPIERDPDLDDLF